jgi:hypothetical protein
MSCAFADRNVTAILHVLSELFYARIPLAAQPD